MNKRSVKKKRPVKPTRSAVPVRKTASRKTAARKSAPRQAARVPEPANAMKRASAMRVAAVESMNVASVTVAQVTAIASSFRMHKFRVGQTVFYTSSPISRPGASGTYEVVRLLPSDGDDYQYRIKNPGEAFERVAKESQLELEH
jgi:hypothetical protein